MTPRKSCNAATAESMAEGRGPSPPLLHAIPARSTVVSASSPPSAVSSSFQFTVNLRWMRWGAFDATGDVTEIVAM
jgi:hypothetical protein